MSDQDQEVFNLAGYTPDVLGQWKYSVPYTRGDFARVLSRWLEDKKPREGDETNWFVIVGCVLVPPDIHDPFESYDTHTFTGFTAVTNYNTENEPTGTTLKRLGRVRKEKGKFRDGEKTIVTFPSNKAIVLNVTPRTGEPASDVEGRLYIEIFRKHFNELGETIKAWGSSEIQTSDEVLSELKSIRDEIRGIKTELPEKQSLNPEEERPPAGRPLDEINKWAYDEVWKRGRENEAVKSEWRTKKEDAGVILANWDDSFRHAIKKRGEEMEEME